MSYWPGVQAGGGLYQDITTTAGTLFLSADVAAHGAYYSNSEGGVFSVVLDGVSLGYWDAGYIGSNKTLRREIDAVAIVSAGIHQVEFLVTRPYVVSDTPEQYLTNLVAWQTGTAAPEPSTWAMMLSGFAALGLADYRASRRTVIA